MHLFVKTALPDQLLSLRHRLAIFLWCGMISLKYPPRGDADLGRVWMKKEKFP